jgi:intracellular sulfur oxidation DsrE/DsrF family protein
VASKQPSLEEIIMPRILLQFFVLVASLALVAAARAADSSSAGTSGATEQVEKVVYHADFADPRRFSAMLASINNMVTTYQSELKEYDVRIVFVSYGIRFLTADPLKGTPFAEDAEFKAQHQELLDRVRSLHDTQGVKLELCNITREAIQLDPKKLLPGVQLVPSGVVRLAELQHQGFAYLKVE